eukprot:GEZU01011345.1.p1 GENE.GEZU01011345.1~~GEZU01011345.1.p1  ORF type:complete len:271 (-),score=79.94 GEZU01011345.1:167-979(-)
MMMMMMNSPSPPSSSSSSSATTPSLGQQQDEPTPAIHKHALLHQQEAREKALEIEVMGDEEYKREKQKIIAEEKARVEAEYRRKENQVLAQEKIARSNEIRNARVTVLKMREEGMREIYQDAADRIIKSSYIDETAYSNLCKDLIVQAMIRMMEPRCKVHVKQSDAHLIEGILRDAEADFKAKTNRSCMLSIDTSKYLPETVSGGVIVANANDTIMCENTLDSRLALCYEQLLPQIRQILFPVVDHNNLRRKGRKALAEAKKEQPASTTA